MTETELNELKNAAEIGEVEAQRTLVDIYDNGVDKDYSKARYWYEKAAPYSVETREALERLS